MKDKRLSKLLNDLERNRLEHIAIQNDIKERIEDLSIKLEKFNFQDAFEQVDFDDDKSDLFFTESSTVNEKFNASPENTHFPHKRTVPTDRYGKDIVIGKTAKLITCGRSKANKGKIVKISNTRTTIKTKKGELYWRNHENIEIIS